MMADYIVNGYAYPSVSEETLDWWLPSLSWISAFSYGFTVEGELIQLEDSGLIGPANEAGVRPMMVLTPLDAEGNFNDNTAIRIFESEQAKERLISNIEANIEQKNMGGVDFDFEYLAADYAGIANQQCTKGVGIWHIADSFKKILMGMSNYGYNWRLPFVQGESKAEKLTNYQAAARAEYYGAVIEYDSQAQAPFFTYTAADGAEHIVWFENEQSWQARLALVGEYGLAGVSIWNIMHIFYGGI